MKKTVILLLAAAWCAVAGATDYKYLVVSSLDGTQLSLAINQCEDNVCQWHDDMHSA